MAAVAACAYPPRVDPGAPAPHRIPPDEIVVRTDRFVFRLGKRIDETWPAKAEESRIALGQEAEVLLQDEDTTVPVLAGELGLAWPSDALEFDAVLADARGDPCDAHLPRLLDVSLHAPEPWVFFACVLERSFTKLEDGSTVFRAMRAVHAGPKQRPEGEAAADEGAYACLVRYAVAAVLVARAEDKKVAGRLELRLGEACSPRLLEWLSKEWVKRVREDETAEAFGARMGEAR